MDNALNLPADQPPWTPTEVCPPPSIDPWPLIHRIIKQARRIADTKSIPYAAVHLGSSIQIIPRCAIGVGCTVLFTWTKTDLSRGITFEQLAKITDQFAIAFSRGLSPACPISCPCDIESTNLLSDPLIV